MKLLKVVAAYIYKAWFLFIKWLLIYILVGGKSTIEKSYKGECDVEKRTPSCELYFKTQAVYILQVIGLFAFHLSLCFPLYWEFIFIFKNWVETLITLFDK